MNNVTLLQLYPDIKIMYILTKLELNYFSLRTILWSNVKHFVGQYNNYWMRNNKLFGNKQVYWLSDKNNFHWEYGHKNNIRHGKTIEYYYGQNQIRRIWEYYNGKLHGEYKWYNSDGTIMDVGKYNNDHKCGKWIINGEEVDVDGKYGK